MKNICFAIAGFTLIAISFLSCKKDTLLTDSSAKISFSQDIILFDTVFVSIGSATKNFKVYNTHSQPIRISSIRLAGGSSSQFRINVNGLPGTSFSDIELRAGDSLWIFAEVTIDPQNQNLPFVVNDSILFETNGNKQQVNLVAWGQQAHFYIAKKYNFGLPPYVVIDTNLNSTTTWTDTLPYVIYGGYAVVDSSTTLIINAGTQIHFSNAAGLWVYKGGTLKVQGTKQNPVVFQGLRLEQSLKDEPGQWERIWINDGGVNQIDYAVIKNGFIGIQCETLTDPAMPQNLSVTNTRIENMSGIGLYAVNFNIKSTNTIFGNCGQYLTALTAGGNYDFRQCTFANYWRSGQRSNPSVYINNYGSDAAGNAVPVKLSGCNFYNCIISGNNDNEFETDMISGADSTYDFRNTLIKADSKHPTNGTGFMNIYRNEDPSFKDVTTNDYSLNAGSFCIDKGDMSLNPSLTTDIDGNVRPSGSAPDLGAIEKP